MMEELQALIFDVDGTLADTERDGHRVAFNRAFADAGLEWDWTVPVYGELLAVTGGKERIRHFVERFEPHFAAPADFDAFVAELHQAKTRHYVRMLEEGAIPMRRGVARLLNEARAAGLRLAVATTTTRVNVDALLTHSLGVDSLAWFEVIAAGDIVAEKKPAADIYHYALEELGLPPSACLAFEDSENGIRSSRGADLATIVTVNDYTRGHRFDDALLVVDDFGEPDHPFHVLQGDADDFRWVSVELLKYLHGQQANAQPNRSSAL